MSARASMGGIVVALVMASLAAAPAHGAGSLPPQTVFRDGTFDNETLASETPPVADLVEGEIAETPQTIDFIWRVADLPDGVGALPEGVTYFFEFSLDDPDGTPDPVYYSLRVRSNYPMGIRAEVEHDIPGSPVGDRIVGGGGILYGDCVRGTVVVCKPMRDTSVVVSVDDTMNTITARVRRADLRDASGAGIAIDGTQLEEAELFRGIAALVGLTSTTVDVADMDVEGEPLYLLGR